MSNDQAPLASFSLTHVYYNPADPASYLCAFLALVPQALVVVYATLAWSTREAEVCLAFAGQLFCEAVNLILKRLIKEERPRHHDQLPHLPFRRGYGMPSSHAQFAGFWALTITLFLLVRYQESGRQRSRQAQQARRVRQPHQPPPAYPSWWLSPAFWDDTAAAPLSLLQRIALSLLAFIGALSVAWSRVYLHYHSFKQVLVGFVAGLAVAAVWFSATALARRWGLLGWALQLPPARYLRLRDLACDEDPLQAGWDRWIEQETAQIAAKTK